VFAQEADAQDADAHEAAAQEALAHDALAHEALAHEALAHDAFAHEALAHEALAQEAFAQEADAHDASSCATCAQLAESKTRSPEPAGSETRNAFSARFGFGGSLTAAALSAETKPTPTDPKSAEGMCVAVSMRAPLTWSGVHVGFLASMYAAIPETSGAANDVPESSM
jgi:hypothetical protein